MTTIQIPKINKRFEVFNKVENDETDLFLYGSIGSGWFADITADDVKYKLDNISTGTINIHINSPGGDVFESIAIHNLLKNHKAKVNVYIDGLAASGGSVIAMAADKIIMPKNTMMMIHKAWTYAAGNSEDLRKVANQLEKIDTAVTESYTTRFVGEKSELETLLAEETWLTAEECKTFGFCDEISDEIEIPEDDEGDELEPKAKILNKYKSSVKKKEEPKETTHNSKNALFTLLTALNTPKR
ncbi:Clp protease [Bacillus cereus]|uniref:head maturation protease, ClpP-related n=1 Tax=Bacillus TaxID=1386 RepID=UPI000BF67829|nr:MULTISPECIES: head maturation protease, ClpP-related [Bacillus cereus group]PFN30834.1 Clp protease [Bacillus cereus]MCU5208133.1 Clp protease ClpP [Bacillus paranthracis]MDA2163404.1 Clp protease ClpP [Bacillus cereus group sp. Bc252]MDF9513367.1 Clp protease ClpP [Bacillus paranthracis]MDF9672345.1 Clp protease ClpP [Bacillus paranthracis]